MDAQEIRVDAIKMCYSTQRPIWTAMADIGSWFTVLNILGFAAVLTNACAPAPPAACAVAFYKYDGKLCYVRRQ